MKKENDTPTPAQMADRYPGAAVDAADDERATTAEEKERTDVLDDNPRSDKPFDAAE